VTDPKFSMMEYVAVKLPFAEELRLFAEAGADAVALSLFKPPRARRESLTDMAEAVRDIGTRVTYCWPEAPSVLPIPGFAGPATPPERIAALVERLPDVAAFGAIGIGCVTGPAGAFSAAAAWRTAVDGLREVAHAAAVYDLRVAIEPIHPDEADVFSFVSTLPDAVRLVDDVGLPNVGIVADMWHLHGGAEIVAELEAYADHIDLVHVCDRRDPTRSTCDRALPGDGVAGVVDMIGALRRAGYAGYYELEVLSDDGTFGHRFTDSLWLMDPADLVALGRERFMDCYRRAPIERG